MNKQTLKNTTSFISILIITMSTSINLQAQEHALKGPPPVPDSSQIVQMIDELKAELSLTEIQKTKVLELHFAHFKEVKEIMEQDRKTLDATKKVFEKRILAQFNKTQKAKFKKIMKTRKPPMKGKQRFPQPKIN